jgi:hypothetical protein
VGRLEITFTVIAVGLAVVVPVALFMFLGLHLFGNRRARDLGKRVHRAVSNDNGQEGKYP